MPLAVLAQHGSGATWKGFSSADCRGTGRRTRCPLRLLAAAGGIAETERSVAVKPECVEKENRNGTGRRDPIA
jgi:hypothetical protein